MIVPIDRTKFNILEQKSSAMHLSSMKFGNMIDEMIRLIHGDVSWCMLFVDDIVLLDETKGGGNY